MDDFGPRHTLFAVARWDVARPEADVIEAKLFLHTQIDNRVSVFGAAHIGRPKNFHEIAGLCFCKIIKILSEVHFMEKARGSRAIGVPATPDALTIALTANHQAFERRVIEMEGAARAQGFDRFHENEVSRAGAVARRSCV